jgi:hypothetical protein
MRQRVARASVQSNGHCSCTLPNLRTARLITEMPSMPENKSKNTKKPINRCYAHSCDRPTISFSHFCHVFFGGTVQGSARRSRRAAAPAAASTTTRTARGAACRARTRAPTRRRTSAGTASTSPRLRTSRSPTGGSTAHTAARPSSDPSLHS